ncbi:MAG TPA: hypothetical protein VGI39_26615 [Polyangiaceae bacterium]|jgi:hypothetical protein
MKVRVLFAIAAAPILLTANAALAQQRPPRVGQDDPPTDETSLPSKGEAPPPPPGEPPSPPSPAPAPSPAPPKWGDLIPYLSKFKTSIIGFVEVDAMHDSTQSFQDGASNAPIARSSTYAGQHGMFQFTSRNTQLGVKLEAPEFHGIRASTLCKGDFFGNQPANPQSGVTENNFLSSPTFRLLHCYFKAENDYVDVLAGLTYYLFGQQNAFFPSSGAFLGLPGMIFSRAPQVRLSHTFRTKPVSVLVAAAADRPPQRDSELPDGEAALRLMFNGWKGAHTPGALGTLVDPLSIGVSGVFRTFRVNELAAVPKASRTENGAGISVDALVPIIPADKIEEHGNSLTMTGNFVTGYGINDLYLGLNGGLKQQNEPLPAGSPPYATATPLNIDPGLAAYDPQGFLHAIDWQSFQVGLQYYFPGSGNVWLTANYTYLHSDNIDRIAPTTAKATVFNKQEYYDASLFWAVTPAVQFGIEYGHVKQTFLDGGEESNDHVQFAGYYNFL